VKQTTSPDQPTTREVNMNDRNTLPQWATLPGLLDQINGRSSHPAYTMDGLRWLVRNADQNGLAVHIRRPAGGRKLLVNVPGFFDWIEQQPNRREA
jgi:hypothetical protein